MTSRRYAILVAGGKGLRMGGVVPKQFQVVAGRPVLMHTIDAFRSFDARVQIIVVLPCEQQAYWAELCEQYHFEVSFLVADGGATRFHSVQNGLALVPDDADALVAVHDGVRPLVSAAVIAACYDEAARSGGVVPVTPVVETLRHLAPAASSAGVTVNRDAYRLVQTPQTFRADLLKAAYRQPYTEAFTDDASVFEAVGNTVALVEGNRENVKLTTPFDLRVAEAFLGDK